MFLMVLLSKTLVKLRCRPENGVLEISEFTPTTGAFAFLRIEEEPGLMRTVRLFVRWTFLGKNPFSGEKPNSGTADFLAH